MIKLKKNDNTPKKSVQKILVEKPRSVQLAISINPAFVNYFSTLDIQIRKPMLSRLKACCDELVSAAANGTLKPINADEELLTLTEHLQKQYCANDDMRDIYDNTSQETCE